MTSRGALAGLLSMAVLVLCGCGGSPGAPPPEDTAPVTTTPAPGGTLVVGYPADFSVLNPVVARSTLEMEVLDFLFPRLVYYDFDCRCQARPGLAESWTFGDDGLSLTFHLRDDAHWTDGEPIDADDVVFTMDLIRDPQVGSPYIALMQNLRAEQPVEKVDAHTVTLHFGARVAQQNMLNQVTACALVPEHVLRDEPRAQLRGSTFNEAPVTAGAFSVGRWTRGLELVLVRNEDPPLSQKAWLDRIVYRVLPEYTTRLMELKTGQIGMMLGIAVEDLSELRRDHPEITLNRRGMRSTDYIAWNLEHDLFKDARVRRALAHAIDVDAMMSALLTSGKEVYGQRAVGTITPELCDVRVPEMTPIAADRAQARTLFAEAGWADTDGDGVLDKDGKPLSFSLVTSGGNPRRSLVQTIVQQQLRDVGVEVALGTLESNAFHGKLIERDFEAVVLGLNGELFVDPSAVWHSSDAPFNVSSYANPRVDALIEEGLLLDDPVEAATRWQELQTLIYEDQPCCFLYWRDEVVGINSRYRGTTIDVLSPFGRMEHWWAAEPQR